MSARKYSHCSRAICLLTLWGCPSPSYCQKYSPCSLLCEFIVASVCGFASRNPRPKRFLFL
ncbi:hypothetical protein LEP1GSC092_0054 [Leptospira interrogans serovar Pyrogenes str. R168]|nr:hypothetical protein LEP1GSC092_0054 [Leptospira interrogans serovar Pyrogenes str. R168]